ncbi:hypothetical protein ADJ70_11315 [Olsenella sp. oral taxon 807]|uniref:tubulin-like doman-containing protein n=1 Tax=Olsenella sp. oral taxon 807 TaxID=712411 RepID=UPI00067A2CB5|nr:tubulin-like doman-containing protein [Olsenella sp. oral taxon 807]AKT49405.1 hypothetical protein ADJ70_11315 [Olsenella sp. oral taxon 807]
MYENLLLSAGGGIVDEALQCAQDDSAVLAIGLGGTGIDCLRTLKAKVHERLRPDNPGDAVPRYDHIKFLAVDSDAKGMKKAQRDGFGELDLDTEFLDISYPNSLSTLFATSRDGLAADPAYREWLQFDDLNKVGTATDGAGGVRQVGRFLLVRRASEFVSTVHDMVTEAMEDANDNKRKVYVHIFSGLGGGTGSGAFLDACYLVREALRRAGAAGNMLMGYLFLPDVNFARDYIPNVVRRCIGSNGYAAMQELDYCMGFGRNGDAWRQAYPGLGEVRCEAQPVDLCHLVAGKTSKGVSLPDAYDHAMSVVADYVTDILAKPEGICGSLTILLSKIRIFSAMERDRQDAGACYDYLVLGASCAVVPYGRIMTYLASGLFQRLEGLGMRGRVPTQQEVGQFQEDVGLTHDALLEELQRGVEVDPGHYDARPADAQKKSSNVEDHYMGLEAAAKGALDRNLADLSREVPGHVRTGLPPDGRAQAVMAKVVNAVLDAMVDPERGPWYASALVRSVKGTDLLAAAWGIEAEAVRECNHEAAQEQKGMPIWDDFARARGKFFVAPNIPFLLKGKYDAFVEATRELTLCRIRRDSYEALENLAGSLAAQIKRLADELTDPFERVMEGLIDTFDANRSYLKAFADGAGAYEQPIVTMSQIAPALDGELEKCDVGKVTQELLDTLLDEGGRAAWGPGGDDAPLARLVSRYFVGTFSDWSQRSLKEYLADRYNIHGNDQKLANKVQGDLLQTMGSRADVLFDTAVGYKLPVSSTLCYVTVPQGFPVVANAAAGYVAAQGAGYSVRMTSATDRVSFLRLKFGVPLWGYAGLARCEAAYTPAPGRHLYERAVHVEGVSDPAEVEASRDWGNLPSPTPRSKMGQGTDPEVRRRADEAAGVLDEALREGVVVRGAREYTIRTIADTFMRGVRDKYDAAARLPAADRLKVQDELRAMDSNRAYDPKKHILSDVMRPQNPKAERTICADLLAKAPVLVEIVRRELEKCREIARCIEDLEPKG